MSEGRESHGDRRGLLAPLREFASDILAHAGRGVWWIALLLLLGSIVEGFGILLLVPLLSVVIDSAPTGSWLGEFTAAMLGLAPATSRFGRILFILIVFALLFTVRGWVILRRDVVLAKLRTGFIQEQRLTLVGLLAHSRWDLLSRLRHGRVTHALGANLEACTIAAHLLLSSAAAFVLLAGQLVLALLISPLLALMIFLLLAVGAIALRPLLRRSQDLGQGVTTSDIGLVASTSEFLGGLKLAISQNLQQSFLDEYREALARARDRRVQFARQHSAAQLALAGVAAAVAGLTVLLSVGVLGLGPAAAIAFLFILGRMNGPASQIQTGAQHVFHALPAYAELKELQAELAAAQRAEPTLANGDPAAIGDAQVRFDAVSYWHGAGSDGQAGVFDLSLSLAPGEFVGLSGPSGAGKTTFADLLVGLYPPRRGQVLIGGRPLEGATLAAWREAVGYVAQDPFLFHDSLRRNLLWARPDATEEALWEALESSGAAELVRRLDGGLDAVVGDRGALLSGGERQRIALARALLRRPRLLLLDEATSALDLASEREILQRLAERSARPTILIIAHRAESLAFCDRVLTLSGGRLDQSLDARRFS